MDSDLIKIKNIADDQWPVYRQIRLEALKEEPQAFGRSLKEEQEFSEERWRRRASNPYCLVAFQGNRPVGTVSGYLDDERGHAHLVGMYVSAPARGQGVGSRLIKRLVENFALHGEVEKIVLTVNQQQVHAVNLYRKLGFSVEHEVKEILGDGCKHWLYRMVLDIPLNSSG